MKGEFVMAKAIIREFKTNLTKLEIGGMVIITIIPTIITFLYCDRSLFLYYMTILTLSFMILNTESQFKEKNYIVILSCPTTRKEYVISKFVGSMFWIIFMALIGYTINKVLHYISPNIFMDISIEKVKMFLPFSLIILGIYFLRYFSFDSSTGKTGNIFIGIIYYIVMITFDNLFLYSTENKVCRRMVELITNNTIFINLTWAILVILILSMLCFISIKTFEGKDL